MRPVSSLFLSLAATAALASTSAAQTVNFEGGTSTPFGWLPDGYAGYTWTNGFAIDATTYFRSASASGGFGTALASGKHVLGNGGGGTLTVAAMDGSLFNFLGGTFAAAWRNGLTLTVRGFNGANEIFTQAVVLDWNNPQALNLAFFGVDRVTFESSGGQWDPNLPVQGNTSFAADDLLFSTGPTTATPEPVTWALMATGLVGIAAINFVRRRRERKAEQA